MGTYLNEGNRLYWESVNSEIHVDKSLLIRETNKRLRTHDKYICLSRPRRFGKSMAAHMLMAYYSRGADSRELFRDKKIYSDPSFEKHLNKYNVIHLTMTKFSHSSVTEMISRLREKLVRDLKSEILDNGIESTQFHPSEDMPLPEILDDYYSLANVPYVFIIDEWDAPMRENMGDENKQKEYLDFLRDLLKDQEYVALAYATGILPVKKYGAHSALNMFKEYSMESAVPFSEYFGFTKEEVDVLCERYGIDRNKAAEWYDGYNVDGIHIYNPNSMVEVCQRKSFYNYWNRTETFEALRKYIILDMEGLRDKVERLIAGERIVFSMEAYQNDMVRFNSADDVLALLVHLGYLTYDKSIETGWIPNNEVANEFYISIAHDHSWDRIMHALKDSEKCLKAILSGDAETVAALVERSHQENTSLIKYNDENSLACVVAIALYYARNRYFTFRELPSGKGYADIVFLPRPGEALPAIVIELKAEASPSIAIDQIKRREYPAALEGYTGEIVLVGINYRTDPAHPEYKKHTCVIERMV